MRLLKTTALLLLSLSLGGCAVQIQDMQWCSPLPGGLGAACDNFLTSNPETLSELQWEQLEASWMNQGYAVECTSSNSLGAIKTEIEELCSKTSCDYPTVQAILAGLKKVQNLGE